MIALSSPVLQVAALVAGSATPGLPAEAAEGTKAKAKAEASASASPVDISGAGTETAVVVAAAEAEAVADARPDTAPSKARTPPEKGATAAGALVSKAAARRVASAFDRLQGAMIVKDMDTDDVATPAPLERPFRLAQAQTGGATAPAGQAAQPTAGPEIAPAPDRSPAPAIDADESLLPGRRRPGAQQALPEKVTQENRGAVRAPPPEAFPRDEFPIPDRWRLVKALCPDKPRFSGIDAVCHSKLDPYHQNVLKGDLPLPVGKLPRWLPIKGDDWFLTLNAVSDTVVEPRSFPTPVNRQDVSNPHSLDVFGHDNSLVLSQTVLFGAVLVKGSTAYQPPHVEYHLTLAFNMNYAEVQERRVLDVRPTRPPHRYDQFLGVQEAFVDYHIRNVSDRYDFDSIRVGIQPFNADFRGFLFQDNQLGVRLFGNRDDNRIQYNLAAFWRLEKDTNSGLNSVVQSPRTDFVFIANVYRQDLPFPGITSQTTLIYNRNREAGEIHVDDNGFPVRPVLLGNLQPRDYDVFYLGYNADGHIGRVNVTSSFYGAFGHDTNSFFTGRPAKIQAFFAASELSYDIDWIRLRLSGLYASGDKKPYDNKETGFDAIFENPIFAGADTSYWIRQSIPFAGGGRAIAISQRNGILNDLRSSKEEGQSNFNNPGTMLLGVGGDFDVTPKLRISANVNHLWFQNTATLRALRNEGDIPKSIGFDYSLSAIYRPKMIQNVVFRLSGAILDPGKGMRDLFTSASSFSGGNRDKYYYSVLFNTILAF